MGVGERKSEKERLPYEAVIEVTEGWCLEVTVEAVTEEVGDPGETHDVIGSDVIHPGPRGRLLQTPDQDPPVRTMRPLPPESKVFDR